MQRNTNNPLLPQALRQRIRKKHIRRLTMPIRHRTSIRHLRIKPKLRQPRRRSLLLWNISRQLLEPNVREADRREFVAIARDDHNPRSTLCGGRRSGGSESREKQVREEEEPNMVRPEVGLDPLDGSGGGEEDGAGVVDHHVNLGSYVFDLRCCCAD